MTTPRRLPVLAWVGVILRGADEPKPREFLNDPTIPPHDRPFTVDEIALGDDARALQTGGRQWTDGNNGARTLSLLNVGGTGADVVVVAGADVKVARITVSGTKVLDAPDVLPSTDESGWDGVQMRSGKADRQEPDGNDPGDKYSPYSALRSTPHPEVRAG